MTFNEPSKTFRPGRVKAILMKFFLRERGAVVILKAVLRMQRGHAHPETLEEVVENKSGKAWDIFGKL